MDTESVNKLYEKLAKKIGNAPSELIFKNNFELLISVILSAQSTDKIVNAITKDIYPKFASPKDLLECGEGKLRRLIKPIGLAPTKAKNIIKTCQILIEKHQGEIPSYREALEALPGVGRKTANVVLNVGFEKPTIAVDTHVFRVSNRTGLAIGKTVEVTEEKLLQVTPRKWMKRAHRLLLLHGRYVCKAKIFSCKECIIEKECQYTEKVFI